MSAPLTAAPGRVCGTCSLCCKVMEIPSLSKPQGVWCPHWAKGAGCSIYGSHPEECKTFICGWLFDANLGDEWKPEKSKLVIKHEGEENRIVVYADPATPDAWRKSPYFEQLKAWAIAGWESGGLVCVMVKRHGTMVLPDTELDMGQVPIGKSIAVTKSFAGYKVAFL